MEDETRTRRAADEPRNFDRFIRPFFEDPGLWPILAVLVLSLCTLGAGAILMVIVSENLFALAALVLAALMTVDMLVRSWRRGSSRLIAGCIVGFWLGCGAIAALAIAVGIV